MKQIPVLLAIIIFCLVSCQGISQDNLQAKDFEKKINKTKNAQLIDVRTPEEYSEGHLENSRNINVNGEEFKEEVAKLDKDQPVFVYCRSGKRSANAAAQLKEMGFKKVYNMEGGILGWEKEGLKVEK